MSKRQERVSEQIHRAVSELLTFETQDPRLDNLTVTRAEVTGDLRRATVYILPGRTPEETRTALAGLHHAQNYLRRALAEQLQLRFVPELEFAIDERTAQANRVEKLLDDLKD